jgi:hypothetical protein
MTPTADIRTDASDATPPSTASLSTPVPQPGVIQRSEFKFLIVFTLALSILTTLPYMAGHLASFPGTVYTDLLGHSFDTNNYLAYARQAASGKWLFRNPMTAEPHRDVFFNIEWLVIGKLSFLLHVPLAFAMNIVRLLSLGLMCFAVYWLSSFLFCSTFIRRVALVAALAGGGFGWLSGLRLLHIPIDSSYFLDLSDPNLFPFYWALKLPHFLVSEAFVVLGLCFFLCAERSRRTFHSIAAGLCYMIAGACRPYDMLFLMAATTLFLAISLWNRRELSWRITLRALPVVMCLPLLGYYYWIFKIHPIFRWWSLPGNPAPSAWLLALGFGMTFLFLPLSAWRLRRGGLGEPGRLMLCCLLIAILFAYSHHLLHFFFQFATNILVPLVMLVLLGLEKPIAEWRENWHWASTGLVAILVVNSFTSIALVGQAALLAARGDFRVDAQLLDSYSWLNAHSRANDVVLADFDNSNSLPQYTHNVVFCGYNNAVRFDDKLKDVQQFLDPKTPNAFRKQLIQQSAIQFVLLTGDEERQFTQMQIAQETFDEAPFGREIFRNHAAIIFSTMLPRPASEATAPAARKDDSMLQ